MQMQRTMTNTKIHGGYRNNKIRTPLGDPRNIGSEDYDGDHTGAQYMNSQYISAQSKPISSRVSYYDPGKNGRRRDKGIPAYQSLTPRLDSMN